MALSQGPSQGQVSLSWTPPSGQFNGYLIELKIGSGNFAPQNDTAHLVPAGATGLTVTLATNAPDFADYTVRMQAVNGTATSAYSNEAVYFRPLNPPLSLVATLDWNTLNASLQWQKDSTGADGCSLQRVQCDSLGNDSGSWTDLPLSSPSATSYIDSGLVQNTYYHYRVANLHGTSSTSPECYSNLIIAGVASPTIVASGYDIQRDATVIDWATTPDAGTVQMMERAPSDGQGNPTGSWITLTLPSSGQAEYLDTTCQECMTYIYRLSNVHGQWISRPAYSRIITTQMFSPVGLQASPTVNGINLTWTNHSLAATQVVLERFAGQSTSTPLDITLAPGATSYLDSASSLGYYTYQIHAENGGNLSPLLSSDSVFTATLNPPDALLFTDSQLTLPSATDGAIEPNGAWALLSSQYSPPNWDIQILSNNDPWAQHQLPSNSKNLNYSLKVDMQDHPHTVYILQDPSDPNYVFLTHLWFDGSAWQSEQIFHYQLPSFQVLLDWVLDASGNPQMIVAQTVAGSSYISTDNLVYVHKSGGNWVAEGMTGLNPAIYLSSYCISLDNLGTPHILVSDTSSNYSVCSPNAQGNWAAETIAPLHPSSSSSTQDSVIRAAWRDSGNAVIFVQRYTLDPSMDACLLAEEKISGAWQAPVTLESLGGVSMTAESSDHSRFAEALYSPLGLKIYDKRGGTWHQTLVAPPNTSIWIQSGFDSLGHLHVLQDHGGTVYTDFHE